MGDGMGWFLFSYTPKGYQNQLKTHETNQILFFDDCNWMQTGDGLSFRFEKIKIRSGRRPRGGNVPSTAKFYGQAQAIPPSTTSCVPVMYFASSDARNKAA